jgi:hypothetical protein
MIRPYSSSSSASGEYRLRRRRTANLVLSAIELADLSGKRIVLAALCGLDTPAVHENGEIAIHFPGLKGLDKPIVWVFPKLLVRLDCGFTEFTVPGKKILG